jgi:hypothetical protein
MNGSTTQGLNWLALGEQSVARTSILEDTTSVTSAVQGQASDKEGKIREGVWMSWTDGSCSDDGKIGAAAVSKYRNQ